MAVNESQIIMQRVAYPKPRYSITEACELLGIKRTRLYQHVNAGRLTLIKDGARSFVLHDELVLLAATGAPPRDAYPTENPE